MNEEILPSEMMKAGECTLPDGTAMKYRLFVPECEEEVPVVVYLHGSGFRGSDKIRLNIYQGADHMSVDEYASKNDEMYKWMFSQRNLSGGGK